MSSFHTILLDSQSFLLRHEIKGRILNMVTAGTQSLIVSQCGIFEGGAGHLLKEVRKESCV